jgi:hypothetical protein
MISIFIFHKHYIFKTSIQLKYSIGCYLGGGGVEKSGKKYGEGGGATPI